MKESKMWEIKEWAEKKGLSITDYDEARKHMSEHKQLWFSYFALLVFVLVLGAYSVFLQTTLDASMANCLVEASSAANLTVEQASAVCGKLMGW